MTNLSAAPGPTVAKRHCFSHHARPVVTVLRLSFRRVLPLHQASPEGATKTRRRQKQQQGEAGKGEVVRQCLRKFPSEERRAAVSEADGLLIRGAAERIARPWLWHWHSPYAIPIMGSPTEDPKRRPSLTCYGDLLQGNPCKH